MVGCPSRVREIGRFYFYFKTRHLKQGQTLEKTSFFRVRFSCEQDGRLKFKLDIGSQVHFIYRLIPRIEFELQLEAGNHPVNRNFTIWSLRQGGGSFLEGLHFLHD
jgi:hypothetical protein